MAFVNPGEIVKKIGIEPGMVVADFGAGSGHYIIPAAELVGSSGKVYAIDIQKELLSAIKLNASSKNLSNVEIVWSDLEKSEGSRLAGGSVDVVIISNILFQLENKEVFIKEAFRVVKNGGRVVVIDWSDSFGGLGPKKESVISKEDCNKIFITQGFILKNEFSAGDHHYGLIFLKP